MPGISMYQEEVDRTKDENHRLEMEGQYDMIRLNITFRLNAVSEILNKSKWDCKTRLEVAAIQLHEIADCVDVIAGEF